MFNRNSARESIVHSRFHSRPIPAPTKDWLHRLNLIVQNNIQDISRIDAELKVIGARPKEESDDPYSREKFLLQEKVRKLFRQFETDISALSFRMSKDISDI